MNATIKSRRLSDVETTFMRLSLFIILAGLLIFNLLTACGKTVSVDNRLYGDWRWIGTGGGFTGRSYTFPDDSVYILRLKTNRHYEESLNGHVYDSGQYSTAVIRNISGINGPAISFTANFDKNQPSMAIRFDHDTLTLMQNAFDGVINSFKRIK